MAGKEKKPKKIPPRFEKEKDELKELNLKKVKGLGKKVKEELELEDDLEEEREIFDEEDEFEEEDY